jgi:hypothetical protein
MSATNYRSRGSQTDRFASRRTEPDDVARPTFGDLAAEPHLQLLQVDATSGFAGRTASAFVLARSGFADGAGAPSHARSFTDGAGAVLEPSKSATRLLAALATTALLSGCVAKSHDPSKDPSNCLQAAAGPSFEAPAPDDVSTEGGGLSGHQRDDGRARDVVPVPVVIKTAGAGGAASNQESSGTGRAVRDRSGLVDAWPEAGRERSGLTARAGLSKG